VFDLSDELAQLREVAASVGAKLATDYVRRDLHLSSASDVLRMVADAGLLGLSVPEEAGGQGAGYLAAGIACEEVSYGDPLAASLVQQSNMAGNLLWRFAQPDVSARWLPELMSGAVTGSLALTEPGVGSDLRGIRMRAEISGGEWVLRGEKSSVSFPESGVFLTLAHAEDGLALFAVPSETPGLVASEIPDLGMRSQGRGLKIFDDVRVPLDHRLGSPGSGLRDTLATLTTGKVCWALSGVGTARASLDEAVRWAKERITFGQPIASRQGVAFPMARASIDIELARLICWKALDRADRGLPHRIEAARAKAWVPRRMFEICHEAMLTIGHVAYSAESAAQVRLRDVIATEMGEGTEQMQLLLLSREIFGINPG
jgi:cyclohexanecarboxyl-CoA dehydrogenase